MRTIEHAERVRVSIGKGAAGPVLVFGGLFALIAARTGLTVATAAIVGAVGGSASLLVHELGHVIAARRHTSVRPISVSLSWLGAATRFDGGYASGREQMRVAIGGPAASLWLAGLLAMTLFVLPESFELKSLVIMLAMLNVGIAGLNLIPAHPLDGYKLVTGLLWATLGSERTARRVTGRLTVVWMALELVAAALLTAEKPVLGETAMVLAVTLLGQKLVLARRRA
jgi:stage IV sporulation protein FB